MATLSDRDIAGVAARAGFKANDLAVAVAVALAESGGNPNALNDANTNGSSDFGLWQINSVHADLLKSGQWSNPNDNARMAYSVYAAAGHSFRPWVTYTTGRYLVFLNRGRRAAGNPTATPNVSGGGTAQAVGFSASSLTDGGTWVRVGMFLGGVAVLYWGLLALTKVDNTLIRLGANAAVTAASGGASAAAKAAKAATVAKAAT